MRIPPPLLAASIALATFASCEFLGPLWISNTYISSVALVVALLGTFMDVSAKRLFVRQGTTVNSMTLNATAIVISSGAYRWSRNPMYLGRIMQLFALSLYLASSIGFLSVLLFAIYLDRVQIRAEEQALTQRFPLEYSTCRSKVRRWL
ncbi:isoprenylcysteine carboxylmethyltransferase family protein [Dyella jejuensis]|uniref:Isoprenylcysteine carboxylmethyltransferase family protein n=2 Tax=Dyella jejuensis TaxID=1432009 RepID=A0ABW8JIX1_9GAMM